MTLDEFIQKHNGKYLEVAGSANAKYQCVDLVNGYIRDVLNLPIIEWTNAVDFPEKVDKDDYYFIKKTPDFIPVKGDICVWHGSWGHISVVYSSDINAFVSFDQNWPTGSPCVFVGHDYSNIKGFLRAKNIPMTEIPEDIKTDANNWKNLRGEALKLGVEIESVKNVTDIIKDNQNLRTDSNNWNAVRKMYDVESVEELDTMVQSLKLAVQEQDCQEIVKSEEQKCVKKIEDLTEKHKEQVDALREMVVSPEGLSFESLLIAIIKKLKVKL